MNINIKGTKVKLTDADKNFIFEKLETLEKFLKNEHVIHFEVEVDKKHKSGDIFRTEVQISPGKVYASTEAEDFYVSVEKTTQKVKEQLAKKKDKIVSKKRKSNTKKV